MKSIIIISTLLFVTASFMGIGNYIRYNDTLREKGLYGTPQEEQIATAVPKQEALEEQLPQQVQSEPEAQFIENKNEVIEKPAITEKKKIVNAKPSQNVARTNTHTTDNEDNRHVLHATKKPKEREINFRSFSRAALDDEPEPVTVVESETEAAPAVTVNNEENE